MCTIHCIGRTTALSLLLSWQEQMQHISFLRDSTGYRFLTHSKANSWSPHHSTPSFQNHHSSDLVGSNLSLHVVKRKHHGSILLPLFPPSSNCDSISKSCRPISKNISTNQPSVWLHCWSKLLSYSSALLHSPLYYSLCLCLCPHKVSGSHSDWSDHFKNKDSYITPLCPTLQWSHLTQN